MTILFTKESGVFFIFLFVHFMMGLQLFAQCPPCPTVSLTTINDKIVFDDFAELTGGITISAVYVDVTSTCEWDLFITDASVPLISSYTAQDAGVLALSAIDIRAVNPCLTADQDYGGGTPPCTPDPTRICSNFNNPLVAGGDNYIIGTAVNPEVPVFPCGIYTGEKNNGACSDADPCDGVGTFISGAGNTLSDPTTHRFRIDLKVTPGIAPVHAGLYQLQLDFQVASDEAVPCMLVAAQFIFQIDIQPVIQLKMTTPAQLDFIFDDIKKYNAGITQYGGTVLNVTSSVNWDLLAVGSSTLNESGGGAFWDNPAFYSGGGTSDIPLNALELHQIPANPLVSGACIDYSPAFTDPVSGNNNIEVAFQGPGGLTFVGPTVCPDICVPGGDKTIAGNWECGAGGTSLGPGTFTPDLVFPVDWNSENFRYVMNYKITPGLPAVFFNGIAPMVNYATPGTYTMQVRYLLFEDQ